MTKFDFGSDWLVFHPIPPKRVDSTPPGPKLDLRGRSFNVKDVWPRKKGKKKGERERGGKGTKNGGEKGQNYHPLWRYDNVAILDYFVYFF